MLIAVLLVGGLLALYLGAEWLVRGSSALALRLGLTPLLVGLTVVAYGTSAPELIVSLAAAWKGQPEIAIGNAIGSNIVNIGLILGLTALLCPLRVQLQVLKESRARALYERLGFRVVGRTDTHFRMEKADHVRTDPGP